MEATDRYKTLGVPYPDPSTMCKGQCDGVGVYPQHWEDPSMTDAEETAWLEAHHAPNAHMEYRPFLFFFKRLVKVPCDNWHFIKCPDCNGTGKAGQPDQSQPA